VITFLAIVSSQLPPSYVVCPLCTSVLSKFGHIFFHSGVTPLEGITRGGPPPPLVMPLCIIV